MIVIQDFNDLKLSIYVTAKETDRMGILNIPTILISYHLLR